MRGKKSKEYSDEAKTSRVTCNKLQIKIEQTPNDEKATQNKTRTNDDDEQRTESKKKHENKLCISFNFSSYAVSE